MQNRIMEARPDLCALMKRVCAGLATPGERESAEVVAAMLAATADAAVGQSGQEQAGGAGTTAPKVQWPP